MVKILGIIDIFAAILLLLTIFKINIPVGLLVFISICLFLKGIISISDIGGMTDMTVMVLLILTYFVVLPWEVLAVAILFIGLKGIMSLLA